MYKKSWIRHKYNQGMVNIYNVEDLTKLIFTGNPFDMYTNVDGGLGIFAGYAQSQLPLKSIFEFPDGPPTIQK